ncbi:hypothetical protein [Bdellovibrio sp. HCB209]|uniref:hypothetical protein n=1 Tax=Bdellovibrio sp. HCB209 TaxID=3394354 RepID=UPI0039B6D933
MNSERKEFVVAIVLSVLIPAAYLVDLYFTGCVSPLMGTGNVECDSTIGKDLLIAMMTILILMGFGLYMFTRSK